MIAISALSFDFRHGALHQLLGVVQLFEHERDVHLRLAGKALAAAVDAVLADQRERVGQQIEGDRQTAARRPIIVSCCSSASWCLSKTDMPTLYFLAAWRAAVRCGWEAARSRLRRSITISATSPGDLPVRPFDSSPPENPVATEPGITSHADVVVPHFLVHHFAEGIQAGLRRAVRRGADERRSFRRGC